MRELLGRWRFARGLSACRASGSQPLVDYANAAWPAKDAPLDEARLLALDFELDGLGPRAHVLQAGWLPFTADRLPLADACSIDIRSLRRLDDRAVTVHGIGEQRAQAGADLRDVAARFLAALGGRVIVAHGAALERGVIERIAQTVFGMAVPVRAICTLELERRLNPSLVGADSYRLAATRRRYNLPDHDQHDALADAVAAGELLMAQRSRMTGTVRLGSLEIW